MAVSETLADLAQESITLIGYIGYMFYVDWHLALVFMTAAPLVVYPLVRLGQRVRKTTRRGQEQLEHVTHLSAEAFTGHRIVKAFGAEEREADRFARASLVLYRTYMRVTASMSVLPPLMEFIGGLAAVGAIWYGSQRISTGQLTTGAFASFLGTAFLMYGPIKKLSRVNAGIQQTIAAADRIFEMLDTHSEVRERPGATAAAAPARGGRVPRCRLRLRRSAGPVRAAPRVVESARGSGRGHRRAQRRGQDDAGQSHSADSSMRPKARS